MTDRTAWCAVCSGPVQVGPAGCLTCEDHTCSQCGERVRVTVGAWNDKTKSDDRLCVPCWSGR